MASAHPRRVKTALERIARALCSHDGLPENTQFEGRPMWESFLPKARIALEVLREPTQEMSEAGAEIIRNVGADESPEAHRSDASNTWRFMIDAALNETNQTGGNQ